MITIFGDRLSGNCWKVKQILDFTGRAYRWEKVNVVAKSTRTAEFLEMNPNGKVPTVRLEGGEILTESNAILNYFAEGTSWLPSGGLARARVLEWQCFEQYSHEPYIGVARYWIYYLNARDDYAAQLPARWEGGYKAFGVMEKRLSKYDWLTDDGPTIADISLYAYTQVADQGDFDLKDYPGLCAWLTRFASLPGYVGLPRP